MTETIQKSAPLILAEIKKAKNILLHCHPSPDPDSVGSALAVKLALEQLGKKATLIKGDSEIPKAFDFPGVKTIVDKSYGEMNLENFDLFIVLDSSSKQMISYKSEVVFPQSMKVVVIDHHISNSSYGHINCVDSGYPATAQILHDLFKEMGIKIDHDIALNLFMGIYTDTGGFRYGRLPSETLKVASELAVLAPDFAKTISIMENSNRKEALIFQNLSLASIKEFCGGKVVVSTVTYEQLVENSITEEDYSGSSIANILRSVIGYDLDISMIETKPGMVKLSFRTRDSEKYDLSKIAVALGGGGHRASAGARLNMTIVEAIDKVVKTAKEIYNL